MATFRTQRNKDNPYFMMDRTAVHDERLSFKAVGILTYLLSKPDNWETILADLVRRHTDGRDSVQTGLKELQEHGYIVHNRERDESGKFIQGRYDVHESPQTDFPVVDNPVVDNPPLVSNDVVVSNEKEEKTFSPIGVDPRAKQVVMMWESIMGKPWATSWSEMMLQDIDDFGISNVEDAMKEAKKREVYTWKYVAGIIRNWAKAGVNKKPSVDKDASRVSKLQFTKGDLYE